MSIISIFSFKIPAWNFWKKYVKVSQLSFFFFNWFKRTVDVAIHFVNVTTVSNLPNPGPQAHPALQYFMKGYQGQDQSDLKGYKVPEGRHCETKGKLPKSHNMSSFNWRIPEHGSLSVLVE